MFNGYKLEKTVGHGIKKADIKVGKYVKKIGKFQLNRVRRL